jgi:hypothetical protein
LPDHSSISLKAATATPAAVKDAMPVQQQLQNEPEIKPFQKTSIQFKLAIGSPDDPLEHEADAMADTIMRMPEQNFIQRKCADCEEEKLQRKLSVSFIQRKESSAGVQASDAISNQINATKGNGSSMDSNTQSFMQSRFGADFSEVKIHTGGESIQMNRELNAKAFTVGNDIYFNEGQYNPNSGEGKHLLAHELTHTVQQGGGHKAGMVQRAEIDDDPVLCERLLDLTPMLEAHINGILASVQGIANGGQRVQAVYNALGAGSPFSHIENWCEALPSGYQNRVPVESSRYATNLYGTRTGSLILPAWLRGERAMGTLINIGGLCIGSDKLGHFFQQGRDYFYIADTLGMGDSYAVGFGQWLEGIMPADPGIRAWIEQMDDAYWPGFARLVAGIPFWQGVYGLSTTGVYSNADLEANRNGMEFYRRVFASPSVVFSAAAYINGQWNERMNPNCFGDDMRRLVAANDPEFTRAYREAVTRAVAEHPYSVNAYTGMGIFESLIPPFIERYTCH